jgi:hypothetical protein
MNKKIYFLACSIIALVIGTTASANWFTDRIFGQQNLGASVFNSSQVGTGASNGLYLKTNGTTSTWSTVSGSSSGTISTSSPLTAGLLVQSTAWNTIANIATNTLNIALGNTTGTLPVNRGGTGLTSGYNNTNWDTAYTNASTSLYSLFQPIGSYLTSYDPFTHPASGQSATTSLMLFNGNATSTGLTVTGSTYLATTGGNVGIGTTTPAQSLSVNGKIYSGTGGFQFPDGSLQTTASASGVAGVASIANSDGTLTISPTTGTAVASLALGHANTWTGQQTFNTQAPILGILGTPAGAFLAVDPTGLIIATTTPATGLDLTAHTWTGLQTMGAGINVPSGVLGYSMEGSLLAYASSTNFDTIFGLRAGGNATTSASIHHTTAIGYKSLSVNTGNDNTATGYGALLSNSTGYENTANGSESLYSNTTGYGNTAIGTFSLFTNTTGYNNTATGYSSLYNNYTGIDNTAYGYWSLQNNGTGHRNVGIGLQALRLNSIGAYNTAVGMSALYNNTTGATSTAVGYNAGRYIANGSTANQTSSFSTYLGSGTMAKADGDTNETVIGNGAIGNGSNTITLGNSEVISTIIPYGNVGIGTTTPDYLLTVLGTASTSQLYTGTSFIPNLGTAAGSFLAVNSSGQIISTTTPTGSMVYPGAGIALSTGSGWGTSITNNSASWNNKWDLASTTIGATYGGTGSTTLSGVLKGAGTGMIQTAVLGTDYIKWTSLSSTFTGLTYTNTTGVFSATSGYSIPTDTSQASWNNKWDLASSTIPVNKGGTSSTTLSGILKGNGTSAVVTAVNGTDYTLTSAQSCTNQVITALTAVGGSTCSSVSNAMLTSSTISGKSLGANLDALTNDATLNGSSYNGSGAISDWGLNLANPNTWTGLQQFGNASTTQLSVGTNMWLTALGSPAGSFLAVNASGQIIATTTPAGGASGVSSIIAGSGISVDHATGNVTITNTGGAGGTPGGSDTQLQFNDSSAFNGSSDLTWDNINKQLKVGSTTGASDGLSNYGLVVINNLNDFGGLYVQNKSTGDSAFSEIDVGADNDGSALAGHYGSFGIVNSGFVNTSSGNIRTVAVNNGGSGYTLGDSLQIIGGDSNAYVEVTATSTNGTVITAVTITDNGTGYSVASGLTLSGGSGSSATLNVTAIYDYSGLSRGDTFFSSTGGNLIVEADGTIGSNNGVIKFLTSGSTNSNERMRILGTGQIGIGTTTATSTLDVKGSFHTEEQTLATSTTMTVNFCGSTSNRLKMGVGTANIAFTWTNFSACPGKTIVLRLWNPNTGVIGSTTFSGSPLYWDGYVNPGNNVTNGGMDEFSFDSVSGSSTPFIWAKLNSTLP